MSVDQGMRAEVYEALKNAHGTRIANTIMDLLPPAGVPELATKQDLAVLRSEMREEFAAVRGEMREESAAVRGEMSSLEARLGERLERALREQTTRYIGWMMGMAGIVLAGVGAAAGLG